MKIFKYTLWIVVLLLLQTVVVNDIRIMSLRPDIILPFVVISAMREDSFKAATVVSIVCAVLVGALCGRNFSFSVLFYTYLAAIVFNTRRYLRHMPDFVRYIIRVIPAAIISEAVSYLILYMSFDWFLKAFILYMLPSALYTVAVSALLYPVFSITLYGSGDRRKQLIVK